MPLFRPGFKVGDRVTLLLYDVWNFARGIAARMSWDVKKLHVSGLVLSVGVKMVVHKNGATDTEYKVDFASNAALPVPESVLRSLRGVYVPGIYLKPDAITSVVRNRRFNTDSS